MGLIVMKDKLEEIYQNTIPHHSFLDKRSIDSCMYQSYMLGKEEEQIKYNKLKIAFLDLLENWGDFGKYNSSRNQMEESWKKEAGLL
jgi:hypothetical protein